MKNLVSAFQSLFVATAEAGGVLAKTAQFTLNNVDWQGTLSKHEPADQAIVDAHLETASARCGETGSH